MTAAVRLSYEHYFEKKIARFGRAAARPPYEIVKLYGICIVAELISRHAHFCCEIYTIFGPQDSCKVDQRQFLMMTPRVNLSVECSIILPCEGRTTAALSSQYSIMIFFFLSKQPLPYEYTSRSCHGKVAILEESG